MHPGLRSGSAPGADSATSAVPRQRCTPGSSMGAPIQCRYAVYRVVVNPVDLASPENPENLEMEPSWGPDSFYDLHLRTLFKYQHHFVSKIHYVMLVISQNQNAGARAKLVANHLTKSTRCGPAVRWAYAVGRH